ncbi:MAG TPA: hypothetical protein VHK27_06095 [Gammaproteobacteria bacterium]|nr:hypothetical protein [Gammaproteobacteria bacterium]
MKCVFCAYMTTVSETEVKDAIYVLGGKSVCADHIDLALSNDDFNAFMDQIIELDKWVREERRRREEDAKLKAYSREQDESTDD